MRIPINATVAEDKLTKYLLVARPWDDKSGFLAQGGFRQENWHELESAIRALASAVDAVEDGVNDYGVFYRVEGPLAGPQGTLNVVLIWMKRSVDQTFHLVTLKPYREKSS